MFKYLGIIFITLALVVAIVPQFTTCQSQGQAISLANGKTIPMKCNWTAQSELALAIPLFAVGAIMSFSKRRESRISLSILGTLLGIAVILMPVYLIGVCSSNMLCNTVMKPTLLSAGAVVTALSLAGLWVSIGVKGKVDELNSAFNTKY
jgi:hypothetical protein